MKKTVKDKLKNDFENGIGLVLDSVLTRIQFNLKP